MTAKLQALITTASDQPGITGATVDHPAFLKHFSEAGRTLQGRIEDSAILQVRITVCIGQLLIKAAIGRAKLPKNRP